jgi:hypothetical protein
MGLSAIKTQARAALHGAMAEPATYTAPGVGGATYPTPEQIDAGLSLTVRWHNKMKITGERDSSDVGILEGINRLVFNTENLDALGLTMARLGIIEIPGYGKRFRLDAHEEPDGPLNDYWSVVELSL